jgi:tetratricopeptide (TPR) repeat protein
MSFMPDNAPLVHLKRAYSFIKEVEESTEELRQAALRYQASVNDDEPFVAGMLSTIKGGRRLAADKAKIVSDLQLALSELDAAEAQDADQEIATPDGTFQAKHLRALAYLQQGLVEALHGTSDQARQYLWQSIQIFETADANYWMAVLYEGDYDPANALRFYERYLELDPDGEHSTAAFRSANEMRNYKRRFRGDWGIFGCLFLAFFPAAIIYYFVKRK